AQNRAGQNRQAEAARSAGLRVGILGRWRGTSVAHRRICETLPFHAPSLMSRWFFSAEPMENRRLCWIDALIATCLYRRDAWSIAAFSVVITAGSMTTT